jgi:hypothetical protein
MGGAATATGLLANSQPSHDTAATAGPIGAAIARRAALARSAFASVYFPTNRSA